MIRFLVLNSLLSVLLISAAGLQGAENVEGVIEAVDREAMTLQLRTGHGKDAVLRASIGRGDARILDQGDAIRGELVPYGKGQRLQTIRPNEPEKRGTVARLGRFLRKDTLKRGSKVFRGVGEYIPKFALYDTNGDLFLSESLKGSYAVMNFIFTRCTMPTMCPAATERMKQLQAMAEEAGIEDLELVSVTLDPEYDTPGIFTAYAADKGIPTDNFHFLGGPVQIVEDLKKQMGVLAEKHPEEIVRHTMSTALIDPTGKIIYRIPGSMWSPEAFLREIRKDIRARRTN